MADTFRCEHPRTPENTVSSGGQSRCRQCYNAYQSSRGRARWAAMEPAERQQDSRRRYLPKQLRAARLKVKHLEAEAERLGIVVDV